jgi:hypothetical protein
MSELPAYRPGSAVRLSMFRRRLALQIRVWVDVTARHDFHPPLTLEKTENSNAFHGRTGGTERPAGSTCCDVSRLRRGRFSAPETNPGFRRPCQRPGRKCERLKRHRRSGYRQTAKSRHPRGECHANVGFYGCGGAQPALLASPSRRVGSCESGNGTRRPAKPIVPIASVLPPNAAQVTSVNFLTYGFERREPSLASG